MRIAAVLLLCGLGVLAGCESAKDRAIREARNRPPDAGVAATPVPPSATLLAHGQNVPRDLRVDGSHLYWLNEGHKAEGKAGVFRVEKNGGEPQMLVEGKGIVGIAVSADSVYALNAMQDQLLKLPKSGGEPQVTQTAGPAAVSVDDKYVYWSAEDGIFRMAHEGGKPEPFQPGVVATMGLTVQSASAFWYSPLSGHIYRLPVSGGKPRSFVEEKDATLHAFIASGDDVFWSLGSEGKAELRRLPMGGGKPTTLASGLRIPVQLAADASHVYYTTGDEVMRVPRSGGAASAVVERTDRSIGVATDDSHVYWTDRGGRIQRVRK